MMDRREFLTLIGCTAVTLTAATVTGVEPVMLWAAPESALSASDEQALNAAVNRIVPHESPALKEAAAQTAQTLVTRVSKDAGFRDTVKSVVEELNARSGESYGKAFSELAPEQQLIIMEGVQNSRAFQHLVNQVLADYYDKPHVWHALGYPGPVNDHEHQMGGYLVQGYDQLDW
jgi:hypothetical protein